MSKTNAEAQTRGISETKKSTLRPRLAIKSVIDNSGSRTKARKNACIAVRLTQQSLTFTTFCGRATKRCINLRRTGPISKLSKRPRTSASRSAQTVIASSIGMRSWHGKTKDACKRKQKQSKLSLSEVTLRRLVETCSTRTSWRGLVVIVWSLPDAGLSSPSPLQGVFLLGDLTGLPPSAWHLNRWLGRKDT